MKQAQKSNKITLFKRLKIIIFNIIISFHWNYIKKGRSLCINYQKNNSNLKDDPAFISAYEKLNKHSVKATIYQNKANRIAEIIYS